MVLEYLLLLASKQHSFRISGPKIVPVHENTDLLGSRNPEQNRGVLGGKQARGTTPCIAASNHIQFTSPQCSCSSSIFPSRSLISNRYQSLFIIDSFRLTRIGCLGYLGSADQSRGGAVRVSAEDRNLMKTYGRSLALEKRDNNLGNRVPRDNTLVTIWLWR